MKSLLQTGTKTALFSMSEINCFTFNEHHVHHKPLNVSMVLLQFSVVRAPLTVNAVYVITCRQWLQHFANADRIPSQLNAYHNANDQFILNMLQKSTRNISQISVPLSKIYCTYHGVMNSTCLPPTPSSGLLPLLVHPLGRSCPQPECKLLKIN